MQYRIFFGKTKTYQSFALGALVKRTAGYAGNARLFQQREGCRFGGWIAQMRHVNQYIICALRYQRRQLGIGQTLADDVPFTLIFGP